MQSSDADPEVLRRFKEALGLETPSGQYRLLAVLQEDWHSGRMGCEGLRLYGIDVDFAFSRQQVIDGLNGSPDIVFVSDGYPRQDGDLLQLVRELGYEGPVVYCTWHGTTCLGWYYGADCVICEWDPGPRMARLIRDIVRSYRAGRGRISLLRKRRRLFISHCSADHDFVERLARSLLARGFFVWFDEWVLKVGDSIIQRIQDAIDESSHLIVVLSPGSVDSKWVREELNSMLKEQVDCSETRVLPILYRQCKLPSFLRDKLYADFTGDFENAFAALMRKMPGRC